MAEKSVTPETLEGFRLSPQQRRVWALVERDGVGAHRVTAEFRVDARPDAGRLSRALDAVAARHEIMRTTFRRLPGMGEPLQVIHDRSMVVLEEQERGPGSFTGDTESGPLSRIVVKRDTSGETTLLLDFSALVADAASLREIAGELFAMLPHGSPASAEAGEILQYADVAEWWNELDRKPESAPGLAFWRRIDWATGGPGLPFDRPSGPGGAFRPERVGSAVPAAMLGRLDEAAGNLQTTPAILLLTAWSVLLRRLLGDAPVRVGRMSDGRRSPELRRAVGPFAHLLPLVLDLEDGLSFHDAVERIGRAVAEQDPWADLFPAVSSKADVDASFPHRFEFAETDGETGAPRLLSIWSTGELFVARLSCLRRGATLDLHVDYDATRLSAPDAESLHARVLRLLGSALDDPAAAIGSLDLLPDAERRRLVEWNATDRTFPDLRPIHERFEDAAAANPDAIAVVCDDRRLTYAALNSRANAIAHRLRQAGVGPDTVVGLLVERSVEMVVGLLAIWKAAGAYLPLDPSLPQERLDFLLEGARIRFLLTRSDLRRRVSLESLAVVQVDDEVAGEISNPEHIARPENLAYVLFTSGSTGVPKGVAVEHRQVSNYVDAILERLDPPRGSSYATVTTLAADLGNTCVFPPLATGGRLHVVTEQRSADPEGLAEDFDREPVDYLKIVPSHLSALLTGSRPARMMPQRCLILGGEASSRTLVERVRELAPRCSILNHYGPTETTVGATTYRIDGAEEARRGPIPIGRPLANCRVYLLDSLGAPAPPGVPAELYVAGAGVARGYFGRPELTAERFVEREVLGRRERLYRTGDLARHRGDGAIEWLGRTDDQVKIHGFRIEPGEIEATLRQHPSVAAAVVLPRESPDGSRRLVAYFVSPERDAVVPALRQLLAARLPEFMMPAAFVALSRLPLTANGKVDRGALPLPDRVHGARDAAAAPATAPEKILARVWGDVLGAGTFGVHDNFFELGGDSILAIQIIARAAKEGLRLTPRQLFEHQTIAELARVAEAAAARDFEPSASAGPVPLTPIQRWFFEQELTDPHHYNQSMLLEMRPRPDPGRLARALAAVIARHDALRARFVRLGEDWRQTVVASEEGEILRTVVVEGADEAARRQTIESATRQAQNSLDLQRGPLVKAVYFDFGAGTAARLLVVVHHLAVDGVSWRVLLEDLEKAYRDLEAGAEIHLPPRTSSFSEWANALSRVVDSASLEAEAADWLAAHAPEPPLPRDADGENTVESARAWTSALAEEETRALLQEVPAAFRTQINDALLAAVAQAFTRWTGRRSLLLDVEGHGREEIAAALDLSRTVGWFTARFPVHLVLPESLDPTESLLAVRDRLRAIPGRGIGYGILRYLSAGGERWSRLPEPEVSFNYLGQVDRIVPRDSLFRPLASPGFNRSPRDRRRHALSIEAKVIGGRLRVSWIYSRNLHRRATMERLAIGFQEALRAIIERSQSAAPAPYSTSDFPKARLSQKDLDKLVARFKAGGSR